MEYSAFIQKIQARIKNNDDPKNICASALCIFDDIKDTPLTDHELDALQSIIFIHGDNCDYREFGKRSPRAVDVQKALDITIEKGSPFEVLLFAGDVGHKLSDLDFKKLEVLMILSNDGNHCASFAALPRADTKALEKIVLKHGDGYSNYCMAKFEGANLPAIQKVIIEKGKAWERLMFASKYADKEGLKALQNAVIDRGHVNEIYRFALIPGANIELIEEHLIESSRTNHEAIDALFSFACNVPNANVKKIQDALMSPDVARYIDPSFWLHFAEHVPGADKTKCQEALLGAMSATDLFMDEVIAFANRVADNDGFLAIQKHIIDSGKINSILLFAGQAIDADIPLLQALVNEKGTVLDCFDFTYIEGADIDALRQRVSEIGTQYNLRDFDEKIQRDHKKSSHLPNGMKI